MLKHLLLMFVITSTAPLLADDDFVSLFDGKTLDGWTALPGGKWKVVDGAIVGTQEKNEKRHGQLLSNRQYTNFIVRLRFKAMEGNSGFYFRVQKVKHVVAVRGFQAEINPEGSDVGGLYETLGRAWVIRPTKEQTKSYFKPKDWNQMSVEAVGGNIRVTVNGKPSVELKDDPGASSGYLGLQLHGNQKMHVQFKDIEIRELPAARQQESATQPGKVEGKTTHPILVADARKGLVVKYTPEGKRVWSYPSHRCLDAWPMEDGQVLMTFNPSKKTEDKGGVRIVDADKKLVFEYLTKGEVMSCQPLPDGNILVSKNSQGEVDIVDRKGKVVRNFPLKAKGMGHRTVRFTRRTNEGTFLAAETYTNEMREYNAAGKLINTIAAPGIFSAQRVGKGHTLISTFYKPRVFEVDKAGKLVWELKPEDLPEDFRARHFGEAHRLPNGNSMICIYSGPTGPRRVQVFEITPKKKIVWALRDSEHLGAVTAAKPILP